MNVLVRKTYKLREQNRDYQEIEMSMRRLVQNVRKVDTI